MSKTVLKNNDNLDFSGSATPDLTTMDHAALLRIARQAMRAPSSAGNIDALLNALKHLQKTQIELAKKEIELAEKEIELTQEKKRSSTDPLTGLLNRRGFVSKLTEEFNRIQRKESNGCVIIALDLDYFKGINDKLGHSVGDEILQHFAKSLQSISRSYDICARQGGDEFFIVFSNIKEKNSNGIEELINKIEQELDKNPFMIDENKIRIQAGKGAVIVDAQYLKLHSNQKIIRDMKSVIDKAINEADQALIKYKDERPPKDRGTLPDNLVHFSR